MSQRELEPAYIAASSIFSPGMRTCRMPGIPALGRKEVCCGNLSQKSKGMTSRFKWFLPVWCLAVGGVQTAAASIPDRYAEVAAEPPARSRALLSVHHMTSKSKMHQGVVEKPGRTNNRLAHEAGVCCLAESRDDLHRDQNAGCNMSEALAATESPIQAGDSTLS